MALPDASLELVFSAKALLPRFKTDAALFAAGAVFFASAARAAAGTAFFAAVALAGGVFLECFAAVPASAFDELLFTVDWVSLATVFAVAMRVLPAGACVSVIVFASLLAVVFNKDLPADLLAGLAFEAAVPLTMLFAALLERAFLGADLVTVAFIFILFLS